MIPIDTNQDNDSDFNIEIIKAVEEQILSPETKYVKDIYESLLQQNTNAENAKKLIAKELIREVDYIHSTNSTFNENRYQENLKNLLSK